MKWMRAVAGFAAWQVAFCACGGAPAPETGVAAPSWEEAADARYAGIEETPAQLSDGRWEGDPFVPGGASRPSLVLARDFWLSGDLDGDGADEAIVLLASQSGGTGSELYLAVLARRDGAVVDTGAVLVGDRVQVREARVEGARVVLDVVQAGPSDAMCCPGEKATRAFGFEGEALVELASRVSGRLTPGDIAGVEWRLERLAWDEPAPAEPEITLVLEGEQVSGQGGCNRYFAPVRAGAAPGDLSIGPIGSTRMACAEAEMALERRYFEALEHARKFGFLAGRLALTVQQGERLETLLFRPRPQER